MIPLEDFPVGLWRMVYKELACCHLEHSFSFLPTLFQFCFIHELKWECTRGWCRLELHTLSLQRLSRQWLWHFYEHFLSCNKCPTCMYQASLGLSVDVQNSNVKCHVTTHSLKKQKTKIVDLQFCHSCKCICMCSFPRKDNKSSTCRKDTNKNNNVRCNMCQT